MSRPIPIEEMVRLFKIRHTTSYLVKIDNFSLLTKYHIERAQSSVFSFGGHKLRLFVYPNGDKHSRGKVTISLQNHDSVKVAFEFELFIVSQLEAKWFTKGKHVFDTTSKRKELVCISLADLKTQGYYLGDCLMFGVKLFGIGTTSAVAECCTFIEKPLNHKVTWMMNNFCPFDLEKTHHSNEFVVGNRKWRIEVHLGGCEEGKHKSLSVYLVGGDFINGVKTETFAHYKLRVLDQVNRHHVEKTCSDWIRTNPNNHHGHSEFMPLEKIGKPYLVNGKLYVGVEFDVISVTNPC